MSWRKCISKNDVGRLSASVKIHLREAENRRARKTAQAARREGEGLLAEAFDHSPIGMALVNLDGTFSRVNPALARLLGRAEPAELVGVSLASLIHPDDAASGVRAMRVISEQEKPSQAEKRYIRTDGAVVDVLLSVVLVRDSGGRPAKFFTQVEDITERKAAEVEYARLAAIVECSQDAIIGGDRCGVITVWNPAAERLYGYAASEVIGRPVSLLVPAARRGEDREFLDRVLAGGRLENYQTERVCKDGSVVNVSLSVSAIHDSAGRVTGASSVARDVTGLIRAQEQIALQAELLDEVDAAVTLTDREGRVRYWSRGAQHLFGYDATEAVGQRTSELIKFQDESPELQSFRHAQVGAAIDAELDVRDKHGRVFPAYVRHRLVALRVGGKASTGLISVGVDITARRKAELALRRHAAGQEEIVDLGRLALKGEPLDALFDHAARAALRVLSADCASVAERLSDARGFMISASVGCPEARKGERIAGDTRSMAGYAVRSRAPVIVADWDTERRFARSCTLSCHGVRSSVCALVGDPGSPFGVLAVHFRQPGLVSADCVPFLDGLANALAEAIQSRNAQEAIRHQALHDGLTGLPNRTLFLDRVTHALARADRRPQRLAVLFIDLDGFKLVNDSFGHEAGDRLLRLLAPRLASAIRASDTLARLGGDEFAVLCELSSEQSAARIAEQLLSSLHEPVLLSGEQHVLSASIGIAINTSECSATDLLRDADAAMYHAKTGGGAQAALFDKQMHERVLRRVRTESALRAALTNEQEIFLHYQPLVSLRTGQIVGAEALARWRHPEWGPVSPLEFIAVAEDSGLIHQLGAHIIRRAARDCAVWQEHPAFAGIAINISTRQLVQPDEVAMLVTQALAREQIAPGFLTLEITESLLIEHLETVQRALKSLQGLGVHLSLDDFGIGYSSLSYLRDLPLDSVKIDRSLIKNIIDTPRVAALAAAIIDMGHALDLHVVAEGIETEQQAAVLRALGCDLAQGYYFARPMAPELLTALLHKQPHWLAPPAKQRRPAQPRRHPRAPDPLVKRAAQ